MLPYKNKIGKIEKFLLPKKNQSKYNFCIFSINNDVTKSISAYSGMLYLTLLRN